MSYFSQLARTCRQLNLLLPTRDRRLIFVSLALAVLMLIFFEPTTDWLEKEVIDGRNFIYGNFIFTKPATATVILAIDAQTLQRTPSPWPWPDARWAQIINTITDNYEPEAVVIDVFFQTRGNTTDQAMSLFEAALKRNGRTGLIGHFEESISENGTHLQMFLPEKNLRKCVPFWGFTQQKIDKDGRVRSFLIADQRMPKKHVACELDQFLSPGNKGDCFGDQFKQNQQTQGLMALRKPAMGFPRISLIDLIDGKIVPEMLKNKIVVIGATAPVLHDFHETSLGLVTGADILCSIIQTVHENRIQIYHPGSLQRSAGLLLGIILSLLLLSDLFRHCMRNYLVAVILLLPLLVFSSFVSACYFPVGLTWFVFVAFSGSVLAAGRIVKLSEIRESLHEAEVCGTIQKKFFPAAELHHASGVSCSGRCLPFKEAGGDYYDYLTLADGRIFFVLGDVSGHGISASMITTIAKTLVSLRAAAGNMDIEELLQDINTAIFLMTGKKRMMTMSVGIIDVAANLIKFFSAGHLPALLRTSKGLTEFAIPSFPLGVTRKLRKIEVKTFPVPDNGFLLLYSDGMVEGLDWQDQQFGFERFNELVKQMRVDTACNTIIDRLYDELAAHAQGRSYGDDVTFLVISFSMLKKEGL